MTGIPFIPFQSRQRGNPVFDLRKVDFPFLHLLDLVDAGLECRLLSLPHSGNDLAEPRASCPADWETLGMVETVIDNLKVVELPKSY